MFAISAFVLAATASPAAKPTPLPTLPPALAKAAMPSVAENQSQISVKVDQPFQIRMNVTAGTGYSWRPQAPIPPGLTLLGVFARPSSKMLPGGPGEEVLVFRAHDVGELDLILEYVRPWEHRTKPAKIDTFKVTVHK